MTPETRADLLIELVGNLIHVMERENEILDHPRSKELGPLVQEKQMLFHSYEGQLQALSRNPAFFMTLDDERREELRALSAKFHEVQTVNERKLRLAVKSSNMIVERIREAATKASGTALNSYGQSGGQQAYQKKAAPIAVNETL
ncbi:hypothetical protein [Aestuariispira insulae]|uniref:FlgN protein n=1 Tax=Aestuariispira insulae TaxID=1461337 RepID=A0A3D9HSX4_9PROT|nr:hypothetical protein [Aestuariispira insulae]RED52451.1 hypothetical protein DFP90_102472 [Aestuariispira insulae]